MAIIKCKMCGGDLVLVEGQSVAECEYCGSKQTVPVADNEKKLNLFAGANKLRLSCEFDRAAGVYDAIKAEFPSEAEAYWGLVLCKYGIEYVDDPATGRKVPTCHRLSFDSVMDDSNLDMAMDCADAVARKVYREEAKHLEKIRQGILQVSSNEKPYDIFICYKETAENGDRTLDSVLAQDIYSALTDKGYRVFFSRITLQSKLGEAYEPYIFAALNSAKVMLAIGTDPEYYSAVWVKNEWSRYLKICAGDNSKHLIPCYKDMDAYDMPREFRPMQGVDLGKMGAVQDILFNMEKYIPLKKQNTTVIQEKVVVGGTGGSNKIASLLDRGNMALEDGDWAKADSFFEDVLNNDSKNAQAYIGKTLAQERCRTMDALVRKRRDVYQNVSSETLYIQEKTAHISEMAEQYSLPGYVEQASIRELYRFDLSYTSEVSGRQKQYREEESWWQNHRWLSRAEKFAVGAVADTILNEKKHLFVQLADRAKKAQEADARAIARLEAAYDTHILEADQRAEQLYNDGLARREKYYQNWLSQAKTETVPSQLLLLAENFVGLGEYQDSKNLAEHCRKRAADEEAKLDAERERQRVIAEQKRKAQQKRNKTIGMIAVACVMLAIAITLVVTQIIIPGNAYKAAETLLANGQYEEALVAFEALGDYKNSADRIAECEAAMDALELANLEEKYNAAVSLMNEGKYEEAITAFEALSGYKDSSDMIAGSNEAIEELQLKAQYDAAAALAESGETAKAALTFGKLKSYSDAWERSRELWAECELETVSAGWEHTVGLRNDGTVVTTGDNKEGRCNTDSWTDIVAVSAGGTHTVGLRSDGTVIAVGYNKDGRCDTQNWKNIIAISAGMYHTIGLRSDGTVVALGDNRQEQCDINDWKNIVAVSAGKYHTVGLRSDGTVVASGYNKYSACDTENWTDIIAVCAGNDHTVGLRSDGTVVAVGYDEVAEGYPTSRCDTENWTDIVAVSAGSSHTVGLRSDGTVVTVGLNEYGQCDTSDWNSIKLPGGR